MVWWKIEYISAEIPSTPFIYSWDKTKKETVYNLSAHWRDLGIKFLYGVYENLKLSFRL